MPLETLFAGCFLLHTCLWCCMASATPSLLDFQYIGCYADGDDSNRDLRGLQGIVKLGPYATKPTVPAFVQKPGEMTLQLCADICNYGRFRYFGVQFAEYCCCGSAYGSLGAAPDSQCNLKCGGNASQVCGGAYRNSIYEITFPKYENISKKLAAASMPNMSSAQSSITHSSFPARVEFECSAACHSSPSCLGSAFSPSGRMCRLLKFHAVPEELASEFEYVWMKP